MSIAAERPDAIDTDAPMWEPGPPVEFTAPSATVHHSELTGLSMLIADGGMRASDLGANLALLIPADARLVKGTSDGEVTVIIFQVAPPRPRDEAPAADEGDVP